VPVVVLVPSIPTFVVVVLVSVYPIHVLLSSETTALSLMIDFVSSAMMNTGSRGKLVSPLK
jgi:hypothetical protein